MMKYLLFILFIYFHVNQETKFINPDDLRFSGLEFSSTKELIWETLGKVEERRVFYECGFHSEDEQGKAFYELNYPSFTWIGNEAEGYTLNKLIFDSEAQIKLNYKNHVFSGKTSQKELEDLFNQKSEPINVFGRDNENLQNISLWFEKSDDGCHFFFKEGKLVEFGYWSPC
jgi:hypothetical protein